MSVENDTVLSQAAPAPVLSGQKDLTHQEPLSFEERVAAFTHSSQQQSNLGFEMSTPSSISEDDKAMLLTLLETSGQYNDYKTITGLAYRRDAVDKDGETALLRAARMGDENVARLLLTANADINHRNKKGATALEWAARRGCRTLTRMMLVAGGHVDNQDVDGETPLAIATRKGHEEAARMLVAAAAEVNIKNKYGMTPLMNAIAGGHQNIARMLLVSNADVNAKNIYGQTPLYWAAREADQGILRMLKSAGVKNVHI